MCSRYVLLLLATLALLADTASAQWQKSPEFPNDFFNEVFFVDNSYGWVTRMSSSVSRTVDGGNSWQSSTLPNAGFSSNRDICFVSRSGGFVSGEDGVWKTTDGGATWTTITPPGFVGASTGMWFTDMSTGIVGSGNCIDSVATFFRTTDGGSTWTSVTDTSSADVAIGGITWSGGVWYVVGGRGKLWRSNDGGATWTRSSTGSNGWQEDIITYGGDLLVASTDGSSCGASNGGTILRSTNGGSTWTSTRFAMNLMWGVTRYSSSDGWCVGDGGLALRTTDGGATWIDQSCGLPRGIRLDDVAFTDATHGWAVGDGLWRLADQTIEVAPDTIDFGDIRVGSTSRDSNAIVRSFFTTTTSASLRLGGVDPAQFAIGGTGAVSIPVGVCSSSPAPVRFAPTSRGVKTALLEVSVASNGIRRYVVLKGRGVEPEIAVSAPPRLDTIVCGTSVVDTILIRNVGTAPLTITSVTARDQAGSTLRPAGPALPQVIAPGGELRLLVRATASAPGPYSSELDIHSDDRLPGHSPFLVRMRFYRRSIVAAYSADTLTLPPARIGQKSAARCIDYRNAGDGDQIIESLDPLTADPTIASTATGFPIAVAAGATVRLCFEGTPSDTGWFTRRFRVRSQPCAQDTVLTIRIYGRAAYGRTDSLVALPAITCETAARAVVTIANDGNDTLVVERPTVSGPDAAGVTLVAPATWPLRIAPRSSAPVLVDLEPVSGSPSATLSFTTNDPRPGRGTLDVRVTTARLSAVARPVLRRVDAGVICVGDRRLVSVLVESVGNAPARVTAARLIDGPADGISILLPPTGVDLVSGARDSLVLAVAPTGPGAFSRLVEIRSAPCDRIDTVEVVGTGAAVMLASDDRLALGTILRGRATTATVTVRNEGNVPATITATAIGAPARVTITSPTLPATIAAGGSLLLSLDVATADAGAIDEELLVIADADCRDTLRFDVSGTVIAPGGVSIVVNTRELRFAELLRCEDTCSSVELESVGTGPISITGARIEGGAPGLRLAPLSTPAEILPGGRFALEVCYEPLADDESVDATLVLTTTDSMLPEIRVPLRATSTSTLTTSSELSFGIVADGIARDTTITIHNRSTRALAITRAVVGAPFEVVTPLPATIAPGDSLALELRARDIDIYQSASLRLETSHPCGDALVVALEAFSDDRFAVEARADTSIARWGELVRIPIGYVDSTRTSLTSFELVVTAAPTLLDPRTIESAAGIVAERLDFDATTGALRLHVSSSDGTPIASSPALLSVVYDVLRGDRIATTVSPVIVGLRRGIASMSTPGAFLLADYCDAYGRLLTVGGAISLAQNVPNPAITSSVIELETAFDGPVSITLHDARGIEVLRLLDEWMPAGRRRIDVPVAGLPAGAYTYRMTTGRRTLTRTMLVVP